jgi:hypothetical protein
MADRPTSLIDREIETKIAAALKAEIAKGKKPSDMGRRDFDAISRAVYPVMSPAARKQTVINGLEYAVKGVFGEMIAEKLWQSGRGYSVTDPELIAIAREFRFVPPEDAPEWMSIFREDLAECTLKRLDETYASADRWRPLLVTEAPGSLLGEVVVRKAAAGDRLALAFLSGRRP